MKLNEGVSGEGNAVPSTFASFPNRYSARACELERSVRAMAFELAEMLFEQYLDKLAERRGVVEERIGGSELRSPSVQLRVIPDGSVELLSTHDQLLGGPSGRAPRLPVSSRNYRYAKAITREAAKVGARLSREGVMGRCAVDFVVVRDQGDVWTPITMDSTCARAAPRTRF